jgi:cytochrome P450 family 109
MAWLGSANRDESKFDRPEEFDIERNPNPHISFGRGIHMCIGSPLARLETRVALRLLIERFESVKLAIRDEAIEPIKNVNVCGFKRLPVALLSR